MLVIKDKLKLNYVAIFSYLMTEFEINGNYIRSKTDYNNSIKLDIFIDSMRFLLKIIESLYIDLPELNKIPGIRECSEIEVSYEDTTGLHSYDNIHIVKDNLESVIKNEFIDTGVNSYYIESISIHEYHISKSTLNKMTNDINYYDRMKSNKLFRV